MHIYLKTIPAKFHPSSIWIDRALGLFWSPTRTRTTIRWVAISWNQFLIQTHNTTHLVHMTVLVVWTEIHTPHQSTSHFGIKFRPNIQTHISHNLSVLWNCWIGDGKCITGLITKKSYDFSQNYLKLDHKSVISCGLAGTIPYDSSFTIIIR